MCMCCDNIIILQHNTLEFDQRKYKLKGKFLEILENRQIDIAMKKYICNSCDILLRNGHFPANILQNSLTSFFCEEVPSKVFYIYDQNVYGNNAFSKQLELNNMTVDEGSVICEKCHKLLINKCEVECIICGNMKQKKYTCVFHRIKYKKILKGNEKLEDILKDKQMKQYICKACHSNIQEQLQCVCCQLDYDTHLCKQYNSSNYDFRNFIVSRCLKCVVDEHKLYLFII